MGWCFGAWQSKKKQEKEKKDTLVEEQIIPRKRNLHDSSQISMDFGVTPGVNLQPSEVSVRLPFVSLQS